VKRLSYIEDAQCLKVNVVNKAINSYGKKRFCATKFRNFVPELRPETPPGSYWLEYKDTFLSLLAIAVSLCL